MKNFNFLSNLLQRVSAMSGMKAETINYDGQPAGNWRANMTSVLRHCKASDVRVAQEWLQKRSARVAQGLRKSVRFAATILVLLWIGVGNVWGQASTHTSNVKLTAGTNGSACTISISGNNYDGIKMGTSKKTGSMSFSVPAGVTTVYIHAAKWNGESGSLNITRSSGTVSPTSVTLTADAGVTGNGSTYTLNAPAKATTDYFFTLTLQSKNTETTITLTTSSNRAVVWGVNTASATKTFTLAVPTGAGGAYNTSKTGQQKSALTGANAISAVSCGNGLNGTYANMWTSTAIETPTYTYPSNVVTSSTADGDLPASGTTLYAVFTTNDEGKYTTNPVCNPACTNGTVSYAKGSVSSGGGSISGTETSDTKVCGTDLTLRGAIFTTTGYTQDGWATSDGGSKAYNLSATNYATEGDATLYPHWTANKYTVTWSVNGSTYHTTSNVSYNTTTSTPANPSVPGECTGSTFMGWTATSNYTGDSAPGDLFNGTSPTITGNITFYAVFADEN